MSEPDAAPSSGADAPEPTPAPADAQAETQAETQGGEAKPADERGFLGLPQLVRDMLGLQWGALAILATVPFVLTLLDYYGMPWHNTSSVKRRPTHGARYREVPRIFDPSRLMRQDAAPLQGHIRDLEMPGPKPVRGYVWWGICCVAFLVLIPMLVGWFVGKQSPRALGIRLKGTGRDAWTYLALFLMFLPVIYLVSRNPAFQNTYPFYKPEGWVTGGDKSIGWDFLLFELVYCSQFFAVEFFFRGFLVIGLKRYIGRASVLVMLAPYCMIHYYKPMPEAMGAIGAGLVLGTLSWRTETILYGWALHYGVALSMDLLALYHLGLL